MAVEWQCSEAYERYIVQPFMTGWTHALLEVAVLAPGTACSTSPVGPVW